MMSINRDSTPCNGDKKKLDLALSRAKVRTNNHFSITFNGDLPHVQSEGQYFDKSFVVYVSLSKLFNGGRNRTFVRFQEQEAIILSKEFLLVGQQIEVLQFFKNVNGCNYVTKFRVLPLHNQKEKYAMVVMGNDDKRPVLFTGSRKPYKYWIKSTLHHDFFPTYNELKKMKPSLDVFFRVISYEVRGNFKDNDFIENSSEEPMELFNVIGPITDEQRNLVSFYCLKKGTQPKTEMSYDDAEFLFSSFEKSRHAAIDYLVHYGH